MASSRGQYRHLYDIPSLPDTLLKQKYAYTPNVYNDPNTVENFMKETIRNTGSDAPLFESDMPRRGGSNPFGQALLSAHEHGSRYSHTPYHPELFLGDLSKDQRQTSYEPVVSQMAEQNRFRQQRYIHGKLQDVADVRTENMVGEKRMLRQVRQGYNDTAARMGGIFDDSSNGINARSSARPARTIQQVGDSIKEDQKIYENGGEKILPQFGASAADKLSNMVGVQWAVQPEAKFGLSSVSNIYRSKQDVDRSVNAVFRLGEQETAFKNNKSGFKNGVRVFQVESMKAARGNAQSTEVVTRRDSIKNKFINAMLPPSAPVNHIERSVVTQGEKRHITTKGTRYKFTPGNNIQESLVEPIKPISDSNIIVNHAVAPTRNAGAILFQVSQDMKNKLPSTTAPPSSMISAKILAKAFTTRVSAYGTQAAKTEGIDIPIMNKAPSGPIDHVGNVEMTKSKFSTNREQMSSNPTGSNNMPVMKTVNDFEFDTDPTMNNDYQTRRGASQRKGKYVPLQDSDNTISPLNDTIVPFRTKYSN
jgi:hypothetical protein